MHDVATVHSYRDGRIKPVDIVLHEASTVLKAAQKHAAALSEIGVTDSELCHLRRLIARVAAYHLTLPEHRTNVVAELHELQFAKEVILRTVELKFGSASDIFMEFCNPEEEQSYVYSHSTS
jgi:hypothetical protein